MSISFLLIRLRTQVLIYIPTSTVSYGDISTTNLLQVSGKKKRMMVHCGVFSPLPHSMELGTYECGKLIIRNHEKIRISVGEPGDFMRI